MIVRPLSRLLLDDAADRPIALSGGHIIDLARFRLDVAGTIARLTATSGRRGLIVCDDAYWATVGMFALAHSGGETVFAPNTLPATIAALAGAYDHVLSDGAMPEASIRLEPAKGVPAAIAPMNADSACVALFTDRKSVV